MFRLLHSILFIKSELRSPFFILCPESPPPPPLRCPQITVLLTSQGKLNVKVQIGAQSYNNVDPPERSSQVYSSVIGIWTDYLA